MMSRASTLERRTRHLEDQANAVAHELAGGRAAASLDEVVRSVGARLGTDLAQVRLHEGADGRTRAAGRDGLAVGRDVYLSSAVDPATPEGHFLVAHELAHVVQQNGGAATDGHALDAAPVAPQGGLLDWFRRTPKQPKQPTSPGTYKDKHLAKGTTAKSLGGDTANEVYRTQYKQKHSTGSTTGYFKEDGDETRSRYAVGASSLAQGMGFGHLIPETFHAEHTITDGTGKKRKAKGAMSLEGRGKSLGDNVNDDITDQMIASGTMPSSQQEFDDYLAPAGYKMRDGRISKPAGAEFEEVDLSDPRTQEQLNQLQWFDALIGNKDRHSGNILFDPATGDVTGIDNDLAFGNGIDTVDSEGSTDGFLQGTNDKYLGLPSMIDGSTAQKLLALSPTAIEEMLNPQGAKGSQRFTDGELQQTYARLAEIQRVVQGKVDSSDLVDQWDQTTYDRAIKEQMNKGVEGMNSRSYVQRHDVYTDKAKDTDNDAFWRRGKRTEDTTPVPKVQTVPQQPAPPRQPPPKPTAPKPVLQPRPLPPVPSVPPTGRPLPPVPSVPSGGPTVRPNYPPPPVPIGSQQLTRPLPPLPPVPDRSTKPTLQRRSRRSQLVQS